MSTNIRPNTAAALTRSVWFVLPAQLRNGAEQCRDHSVGARDIVVLLIELPPTPRCGLCVETEG